MHLRSTGGATRQYGLPTVATHKKRWPDGKKKQTAKQYSIGIPFGDNFVPKMEKNRKRKHVKFDAGKVKKNDPRIVPKPYFHRLFIALGSNSSLIWVDF